MAAELAGVNIFDVSGGSGPNPVRGAMTALQICRTTPGELNKWETRLRLKNWALSYLLVLL